MSHPHEPADPDWNGRFYEGYAVLESGRDQNPDGSVEFWSRTAYYGKNGEFRHRTDKRVVVRLLTA